MPRYKVVCTCKTEFWVKRRVKLDDAAKQALQGRGRSICAECAALLKERWQALHAQEFQPISADMEEVSKIMTKLRANEPFGFSRQPFRERFTEVLEGDRKTLAEGIRTRYRGFSPTWAMFQVRYRIALGEWILRQIDLAKLKTNLM